MDIDLLMISEEFFPCNNLIVPAMLWECIVQYCTSSYSVIVCLTAFLHLYNSLWAAIDA